MGWLTCTVEKYEFHLLLPTGTMQTILEQRNGLKGETLDEVTREIESRGNFNIQCYYSDNIIPQRGVKACKENWAKSMIGKESGKPVLGEGIGTYTKRLT